MARRGFAVGPYSRPEGLAKLDQRSREARYLHETVIELTEHVGTPSIAQRRLIHRAAWIALHLALLDVRTMECGVLSERDGRQYCAWHNSYTRTLVALGLGARAPEQQSLADTLAQKAA